MPPWRSRTWGRAGCRRDDAAGIMITGWAGGGGALGVAVVATAGLLATFYRPNAGPGPEPVAKSATASLAQSYVNMYVDK